MNIPLKKLSLYSSGVGFFEHSAALDAAADIKLSFKADAVNDALKSLAVNDPASQFPAVRYALSSAMQDALKSFKVDLSGSPGIAEILMAQRGAEIEVTAPTPIKGRILSVEKREIVSAAGNGAEEDWFSLVTAAGIKAIAVKEVSAFVFTDKELNDDLNRALDQLLSMKNRETRELVLSLPGDKSRDVSVNYVIPMPIWKVSYRLDLNGEKPLMQGWAIVDNDSDTDWEDVELSLVTGRPVSFIQNLYSPYHTYRPEEPLAIAQFAKARVYESGSKQKKSENFALASRNYKIREPDAMPMMEAAYSMDYCMDEEAVEYSEGKQSISEGVIETAAAESVGANFKFTFGHPVSLGRRQSSMFPLLESAIDAEKILVLSEKDMRGVNPVHPVTALALNNNTGIKLPAGPITVYDGAYAGDALIEFLPENEKRIISYGEELTVSATMEVLYNKNITTVFVLKGVMTINSRNITQKTYTIRNASNEARNVLVEHNISEGYKLLAPDAFYEKTAKVYRFKIEAPPEQEIKFTCKEEKMLCEEIRLINLNPSRLVSYITSGEIPLNVRLALQKAIDLKNKTTDLKAEIEKLKEDRIRIIADQERIRHNLEAAGSSSSQGQKYLERLVAMDAEIDMLDEEISGTEESVETSERKYNSYLEKMVIEKDNP